MSRETIKSFVYRSYREGSDAMETWRAVQSLFPHKLCSWGYIVRLRRHIAEGDRIAEAFVNLMSEARTRR